MNDPKKPVDENPGSINEPPGSDVAPPAPAPEPAPADEDEDEEQDE